MLNDVIELISYTITQDEIGQDIETPVYQEAFAREKGVPRSEFFAAGQNGIRPAVMFQVWTAEYNKQKDLRVGGSEGTVYSIYRAYEKEDEFTELYCEVRAGG